MGKYRKKPVVIDAVRWTGENIDEILTFADGGPCPLWGDDFLVDKDKQEVVISTLEGLMTAGLGDWIIRGVKGEYYPCKHDIFIATYEQEDLSTAGGWIECIVCGREWPWMDASSFRECECGNPYVFGHRDAPV